jgi:hypothetical protein
MWTDPGNIYIPHRHMNVEIGAEATQFPEKVYLNGIAIAVCSVGCDNLLQIVRHFGHFIKKNLLIRLAIMAV